MTPDEGSHAIAFEANGAGVSIRYSPRDLLGPVVANSLPLGWTPRGPLEGDAEFELALDGGGAYAVTMDGDELFRGTALGTALASLRSYVFAHVLEHAQERLFIHAGCVGHRGGAILLPGKGNSGKSTLVAALLRAGADYYTDDYAPLDSDGLVHPYPLALWISNRETGLGGPRSPQSFGATVGEDPLRVVVVAKIAFHYGHGWEVRDRGPSQGALFLLQHSLGHEHRPEFALTATRRAVSNAVVIEGERGEADAAATALLQLAERTLIR